MSTENMRKLMMLAESLDEDYRDDPNRPGWQDEEGNWHSYEDETCPHCQGWGEYIDPEGFDEPVVCPHCDPDEEPIRKSRLVKDMAMDMDMDWTDLGLSDVDPEDLKGFPKINEAFTRKHFQMIADTLQKIEDPEIRRAQAEEYAAQFAADNPRFRRDLFMKAAGVEELSEEEDDGDVPSRRVSDEELMAKVEEKLASAINSVQMGLTNTNDLSAKSGAVRLRKYLEGLKASVEASVDPSGIRNKIHVAFSMADSLSDDSYDFDDALIDLQDIENLLYLHLSGRPVAIDEEASCPCGKEGCECGPDCDCEPVEEDRKKRERPEVKGINDKYDDELKCKHCGDYFCTSKFGGDCPEIQMDMFGDIELDEIVESILNERGMPKDYEMSDEELAAEIEDETSEFERDKIDPEIEDEELGLRFD